MIRGTTPDYLLRVKDQDLTDKTVYVTVAQGNNKVTISGVDLVITTEGDDSIIAFRLTQLQTLSLKEGKAKVQVRFIDAENKAQATNMQDIEVHPVLLEKVIRYGND